MFKLCIIYHFDHQSLVLSCYMEISIYMIARKKSFASEYPIIFTNWEIKKNVFGLLNHAGYRQSLYVFVSSFNSLCNALS